MNRKKYNLISFAVIEIVAIGFLFGYSMTNSGSHLIIGSVFAAYTFLALFFGIVLAFVVSDDRAMAKRKEILAEMEQRFRENLQSAIMQERLSCGKVSVNMARAVSDRVANRILSKHVPGLQDNAVRKSLLESVNKIIDEEMELLKKATLDEASM